MSPLRGYESPDLSSAAHIVLIMAITVSVLGSGSRGNATFIKTEQVRLLIDAGMSRKEIAKRLETIGEDPDGIDAIFITHEHTDHSGGLRTLLSELPAEAYMTWGTRRSLEMDEGIVQIKPGVPFSVGDAEVLPFRVPHDAAEPVAFSITSGGVKITQLTDIGYLPDDVAGHLGGSHVLILESNHDLEMLRVGPYPWNLKQRLMGRYGHLSNLAVGRFLRDQYDGMATHLVLAHLSSKNNHPEIARQEAARALRMRGLDTAGLKVTSQDEAMEPIRIY
jgi:phosphoribosyl 1,2-cyclic phosphodiesterase